MMCVNPTDRVIEPVSPADWVRAQPLDFLMDCGNFGVGDLIMNVLRAIEVFAFNHKIDMSDVRIVDFVWRGEIRPLGDTDKLTSDDSALILTLEARTA